MTEKEERIIKVIWGSSGFECSKHCAIEHAQNASNPNDSLKRGRILLLNKTQKRVS